MKKKGREGASLGKVAFHFALTRQIISVLALLVFIMCAFINSVSASKVLFPSNKFILAITVV